MNYNGWITERLPTEGDATITGAVLVSHDEGDSIYFQSWENVKPGTPWQPLPAPYVKPKRWSVDWNHYGNCYVITDGEQRIQLHFNQCKDAAQRICDIYNEVMP